MTQVPLDEDAIHFTIGLLLGLLGRKEARDYLISRGVTYHEIHQARDALRTIAERFYTRAAPS